MADLSRLGKSLTCPMLMRAFFCAWARQAWQSMPSLYLLYWTQTPLHL